MFSFGNYAGTGAGTSSGDNLVEAFGVSPSLEMLSFWVQVSDDHRSGYKSRNAMIHSLDATTEIRGPVTDPVNSPSVMMASSGPLSEDIHVFDGTAQVYVAFVGRARVIWALKTPEDQQAQWKLLGR